MAIHSHDSLVRHAGSKIDIAIFAAACYNAGMIECPECEGEAVTRKRAGVVVAHVCAKCHGIGGRVSDHYPPPAPVEAEAEDEGA